jgi:predicted nucleotidyltransferase
MEKIIGQFFDNPEREFYIREIARIVKKSPTTVSAKLDELVKKGILLREKKLNHCLFKANTENRVYRREKLVYNLAFVQNNLLDFLVEEFNFPQAIILFGSFAKAENDLNSDIDLLVVSSSKKNINLKKFEEKIKRKIQLFVHSKEDIDKMKKTSPELVNSWVNGIKLYGNWELFR